jgi:MoxR-like ATPase
MPTPQLNAAELTDYLLRALAIGQQALILGPPGCGKSAIVEQVTETLGYNLITIYPALSDPTDIKGYLTLDAEGEPHFRAAGELGEVMRATTPTVLFLDELGQASESVQKACMSLVWARRVGEKKLPD